MDDIVINARSHDQLQMMFNRLRHYTRIFTAKINQSKSVILRLVPPTRGRHMNRVPIIHQVLGRRIICDGLPLKFVSEALYLGCMLNTNFNYNSNIKLRCKSGQSTLATMLSKFNPNLKTKYIYIVYCICIYQSIY